jgi:DHA2 family multidrug resistance protein
LTFSAARWLLTVAAMLATLLYTIDSTIVNVALPHIQGSLQATQDQAAWIVTSYIVISAIATPLAGWLGTRFGLRRILVASIAGFTLGSMLCGVATDLAQMVLFRMLQGAFGAALVPLSQVALMQEFPREAHGRVMALWGMGVLVGPVIGPTLGGWLTDTLSWRWAFYINLPVGALAMLGVLAGLPKQRGDERRPFDLLGFVILSVAIGMFQLLLDRGETKDWFESGEIIAEAVAAAVALYMFIVHALTSAHPFVDLRLFRDRNFSASLGVMLAIGMSIMSPAVLLPTFLQQLQGYSPTQAGVLIASRGAASIVAMLVVGRLVGRLDVRLLTSIGIAAAALSLWMMSAFSIDTPASFIALTGAIQGFGTPMTFMPLTIAAYATLPQTTRSEAGALLTLVRNIGSSVGISLVVAELAHSTQINRSYLAEHFTAYSAARWQALGTVPGANAATGGLLAELQRQAAAIAYSNDFYMLASVTLAALPLVLLLRMHRQAPAMAAERLDAGH